MKLHAVIVGIDPGMHSGAILMRMWKLDEGPTIPGIAVVTHERFQGFGLEKRTQTVFDGLGAFVSGTRSILDEAFEIAEDPTTGKRVPVFAAVERFVPTKTSLMGGGAHAQEKIGIIKGYRYLFYPQLLVDVTQKSAAKATITNTLLVELGLKARRDGLPDHAHDAARHAVLLASRLRGLGVLSVVRGCNDDAYTKSM